MRRKVCQLLAGTIFMVICASSCYETGKITRRYTAIIENDPNAATYLGYIHVNGIALDVDSLQPAKKTPRNIFTLSDHGQEAYINTIKTYAADAKSLQGLLPTVLEPKDNSQGVAHHISFTKRLVFSVQDVSPYEADRITRLTIKIPIQVGHQVHITSITQLQTAYATINLGSVSLTNALTAGLTASYGLTGGTTNSTTNTDYGTSTNGSGISTTKGSSVTPTAGLSGTLSDTRTMAETVNLTNRYVSLSVGLIDDNIEIYEESIAGVNLIGNVFVDVTMETDAPVTRAFAEIGDLFEDKTDPVTHVKAKVPVAASVVPISFQYVEEPGLDKDFTVPYECQARVRHVAEHARTILESDDIISFAEGKVSSGKPLTVLSAKKVLTRPFVMEDSAHNYTGLSIRDNITNQSAPVTFDDYFQAQNLLRWLKRMKRDGKVPCDFKNGLVISDGSNEYSLLVMDPKVCIASFIDGAFVHSQW